MFTAVYTFLLFLILAYLVSNEIYAVYSSTAHWLFDWLYWLMACEELNGLTLRLQWATELGADDLPDRALKETGIE